MDESVGSHWLLLIHQIPPKPPYLRVKVWRRLQRLGAVAVKNSVYVLPASEQAREDFTWVLREVEEGGGDASLVEARFVGGLSDAQVEDLFRAARDADYGQIAEEAKRIEGDFAAATAVDAERQGPLGADVRRLRRRLAEVAALDFFGAAGRDAVEGLLQSLERRLRPPPSVVEGASPEEVRVDLRRRTWVTRRGIKVDRMASAWLIRRFIDPEARFRFVDAQGFHPEAGELRFDMFEAEFTHEGDRCTFEVLLARAGIEDPALVALAEVVHDIDLKDGKFGRPETAGVNALVAGIAAAHADDEARLARASALFDDLYEAFRKRSA
ncbi:chromate resistance protein [Myxococcota bacterium]|nr:chromate resistance protein [Myxococcota bacterium]MCK6575918.1 chromate resistance protein [Myxococcota bacterium]